VRFESLLASQYESTHAHGGSHPVSSRRGHLERMIAELTGSSGGVILVTGESGSGKSWLIGRLVAALGPTWRPVAITLASGIDAFGVWELIARRLGQPSSATITHAWGRVNEALFEETAEGRKVVLLVDHLESAADASMEVIRILAESVGRPGGLGALVLEGQTAAAHRLMQRRSAALGSLVSLHVPLLPLDFEESLELLGVSPGLDAADRARLQRLHRDARGNARRLRKLAGQDPALRTLLGKTSEASRPIVDDEHAFRFQGLEHPRPAEQAPVVPELLPSRPPLRVEEGLIEVGWDGDLESEFDSHAASGAKTGALAPSQPVAADHGEEPIDDPLAALQARAESLRNQALSAGQGSGLTLSQAEDSAADEETAECLAGAPASTSVGESARGRSLHRGELRHAQAPSSHLFTTPRRGA